jgi:hypothetical protein
MSNVHNASACSFGNHAISFSEPTAQNQGCKAADQDVHSCNFPGWDIRWAHANASRFTDAGGDPVV